MTSRRDPGSLLPLTPAMFHVLVALADGETHGYAIMKEVEQLTGGAVRLSTGTLYGIIKRLLGEGLVRESRAGASPSREDGRRRTYELTIFGREVARAEAGRLEETLAMARKKSLFRVTR
jgi:DNA-binding PadR family transcriptional regulator